MQSVRFILLTLALIDQLAIAGKTLSLTKGECALSIMSANHTSNHDALRYNPPRPDVKIHSPLPVTDDPSSLSWAESSRISLWERLTERLSDEAKEILQEHATDPTPTTVYIYTGPNAMKWTTMANYLTRELAQASDIEGSNYNGAAVEIAAGAIGIGAFLTGLTSPLLVCANCVAMGIAWFTGALSWPYALGSAVSLPPLLAIGVVGGFWVSAGIEDWYDSIHRRSMQSIEEVAKSRVAHSFSSKLAAFYRSDMEDTLVSDLSPYDDNGSYRVRFIAGRIPAEEAGYTDDDQLLIVIVEPVDEAVPD